MTPLRRDAGLDLEIDGRAAGAQLVRLGPDEYELHCDGGIERIHLAIDGDRTFVHLRGRVVEVERVDLLARVRERTRARGSAGDHRAPMPGIVVELRVAVGDEVREGDALLVIESMKLQTTIAAETGGRVAEIAAAAGQGFRKGDVLVRIERDDAEEGAP